MDVFLARQPIFNRDKKVVAYEILYREGVKNLYDPSNDGDMATTSVISDTLVNFGIEGLTKGKKAFINFTHNLLMADMPFLIDSERLIVEILETVEIDAKVVEKCRKLKAAGYSIALDDFIDHERYLPIIEYVDILKIDFLIVSSVERKRVAEKYKPLGLLLLAEKVESYREYEEALNLGFDYFQGFFFEKPIVCKTKGIQVATTNYFEIIKETVTEEPDFNKLTAIIKGDLSLTYKLLRMINSPAFYRHTEITSITQALTLLGLNEIRKWITLILLRDVSSDKPDEIVTVSLSRAFFAERIAPYIDLEIRANEAFLVGLFSMIDAIMEKPLFDILDELPLKEDVKSALMGMKNPFHDILKLSRHYEKGEWALVEQMALGLGLDCQTLNSIYVQTAIDATKVLMES